MTEEIKANAATRQLTIEPDWEQRRYEVSLHLMTFLLDRYTSLGCSLKNPAERAAIDAVQAADKLIRQLKECER